MDVGLGMQLQTRDGEDAGSVDRLIVDPATGAVRAIVLRKGAILPREVEVPMGALEVEDDAGVRLAYTADQLAALPPFAAERYAPPAGYASTLGYPAGALHWPLEAALAPEAAVENTARGSAGREAATIREGSAVYSCDGQAVGTVHRLTYDPDSGALRHFVVREGILFTRDVALPASVIERVEGDVVRLAVDAAELPGVGPA